MPFVAALFAIVPGAERLASQAAGGTLPNGRWIGVLQHPGFVQMTLQFTGSAAGGGGVPGVLRVEPLISGRADHRLPTGDVQVSVIYDPAARTVEITPAANSYYQVGFSLPTLRGVHDQERGGIGGVLDGKGRTPGSYFVLAPAEVAESEL